MLRKQLLLNGLMIVALMLFGSSLAQGQAVTCQPLSDNEALKFITERGQLFVKGSAVECKAGEALILIRYQIVEYTARYDCEIRVKGEKPYCWRLS